MSNDANSEFVNWLKRKVNASTDADFEKIVNDLTDEDINNYHDTYTSSIKRSFKVGGVLEYVKCLNKNISLRKSGGKMISKCKCGGKSMMERGGKIKEGTDNAKQDIKDGSINRIKSSVNDSEKTSTKVVLPKMKKAMPNPNSKKMMEKGGKMRAEKTPQLKVKKGVSEPDNIQKKGGVKEKRYMK